MIWPSCYHHNTSIWYHVLLPLHIQQGSICLSEFAHLSITMLVTFQTVLWLPSVDTGLHISKCWPNHLPGFPFKCPGLGQPTSREPLRITLSPSSAGQGYWIPSSPAHALSSPHTTSAILSSLLTSQGNSDWFPKFPCSYDNWQLW